MGRRYPKFRTYNSRVVERVLLTTLRKLLRVSGCQGTKKPKGNREKLALPHQSISIRAVPVTKELITKCARSAQRGSVEMKVRFTHTREFNGSYEDVPQEDNRDRLP